MTYLRRRPSRGGYSSPPSHLAVPHYRVVDWGPGPREHLSKLPVGGASAAASALLPTSARAEPGRQQLSQASPAQLLPDSLAGPDQEKPAAPRGWWDDHAVPQLGHPRASLLGSASLANTSPSCPGVSHLRPFCYCWSPAQALPGAWRALWAPIGSPNFKIPRTDVSGAEYDQHHSRPCGDNAQGACRRAGDPGCSSACTGFGGRDSSVARGLCKFNFQLS